MQICAGLDCACPELGKQLTSFRDRRSIDGRMYLPGGVVSILLEYLPTLSGKKLADARLASKARLDAATPTPYLACAK